MSIWSENEFPALNASLAVSFDQQWIGRGRTLSGKTDHWKAKKRKPYCWTPTKPFYFGGKRFIALYPCIAFETTNFGHVIQKTWEGLKSARE